jgi:hypothetical protein
VGRVAVLAVAAGVCATTPRAGARADTTAIDITSNTVSSTYVPGGPGFNYSQGTYELGYQFSVNAPIYATQLGMYDATLTGATQSFQPSAVGLYDLTSGMLLASGTVTASEPANGLFRYTPITPTAIVPGDDYAVVGVTSSNLYLVAEPVTSATINGINLLSGATYGDSSGNGFPTSTLRLPQSFGDGNIFGHPVPSTVLPDFGANLQFVNTTYNVPPTEATTVTNGPYTDTLDYQVVNPPPSAGNGPGGLYHYVYNVIYDGSATLVIPLFAPGDVKDLAANGCTLEGYDSISGNLQADFGTSYTSALSCLLPYAAQQTNYEFSFDSAYIPTEVTVAMIDEAGVIHLIDPPIPDDPQGRQSVPEPSTIGAFVVGLALLGWRRRGRAPSWKVIAIA